ncbi:nucleoside monophosphate kinase [Flavitalea sp. BT771]|uniref:adenylate kinase family protein n=1 Tax=Flavitalea sp. BT771 TaxID=3063329 RepID=UPI0026E1D562|nr:nucleoside monophosphate kinase [Flavitalea sp. BT771]MDO6432711.1 nucleoside monophosphate kinase [Flavitalea sp. BT771]MDV6222013.1 nucleoside monophosphate kinase [Flavitalea sp. BT771]
MKIIIVTGPPYSGKGTHCEVISKAIGCMHISTGERCRRERSDRTEIGLIISRFEEKGDLVPDAIMKDLFSQIIDENRNENGIVLDGYPRTKAQVDDLIALVNSKKETIDLVINIEVPKAELLARAGKRAEASDREDDKDPQIHLKRVQVFETSTRPAIEYMKLLLRVVDIDGTGSIAEVTHRISEHITLI